MKINQTYKQTYCSKTQQNYNIKVKTGNINFGKNITNKAGELNNAKQKLKNYILGGILVLGLPQCFTPERYSKIEEQDNVKIEYFDVKKTTMDSITKPLFELKEKLNKKNDFISGISIDVTQNYKNLDNNDSFRRYLKERKSTRNVKGCSFYSDKLLQRKIAIQESAHRGNVFVNGIKKASFSDIPALHQTLMHEVGHQFDEYFGHNHNAKFAKDWDRIMAKKENSKDTNPYANPTDLSEKRAMILYDWNNTLSDKKEFQNALLKDIRYIAKLNKNNKDLLAKNIDYYIKYIDLDKDITEEIVDLLNNNRSEIYANLFSYALGEDDGNKDKFTENFKNCYKVVKKDIKSHLNIKL